MSLNELNEFYPNDLLDKLSKKSKKVFLCGDFNKNLLDYDQDTSTNEFIDSLTSQLFQPCIFKPTRVRHDSKTLIDYVFSNAISSNIIFGNLTSSITDYLPQFLLAPNIP